MRLGIDFDNTIICYDEIFDRLASQHIHPAGPPLAGKNRLRDHLRKVNQENVWTEIQGEVYGRYISEAKPYDGVFDAIRVIGQSRVEMRIISHKSRNPYLGKPYDLHKSAMTWLTDHRFFDESGLGFNRSDVFFEFTKKAKVDRVVQQKCTHFIDDLPEILELLPDNITKILFSPAHLIEANLDWSVINSWSDLPSVLK